MKKFSRIDRLPPYTLGIVNELKHKARQKGEDIIDFGLRPSITGTDLGNKQAFYSIEYYREHIRSSAFLKPNEGNRTIIILTEVEKMRVDH